MQSSFVTSRGGLQARPRLGRGPSAVRGPLSRSARLARTQASNREEIKRLEDEKVGLRAEAEAPFRSLRLVLFGFSVVSASVGTLISLPQLAGALGGARGALLVSDVIQNIGINLGAVAIFGFLFRQDWKARERQISRLGRESALGAQKVRLANGKRVRLADLQGTSRVVLVAGTPPQVAASLAEAERYREQLQARGVFVVPLAIFDAPAASGGEAGGGGGEPGGGGEGAQQQLPPLSPGDLRWRGEGEGLGGYRQFFKDQLALASSKVNRDTGLYVGLRLDGRVRASGMGGAPWARMVAELAPLEGDKKWSGFMSGFDGDSAPR